MLFVSYRRHGDARAREELIERTLPLARLLARRYQHGNEPTEDLVQVASLALVKAVDRFEPGRGIGFATFAVPTILGELKRYFRDTSWALHVPRGMQERVLEIRQANEQLLTELGRSPSPKQLAERIGTTSERIVEALDAASAYETISLDAPLCRDQGESGTIADGLGQIDTRLDAAEDWASLERGLRHLSERERLILCLRFAEGLTQTEIAARVGVSQMHVSRLIRGSLDRLALITRGVPTPVTHDSPPRANQPRSGCSGRKLVDAGRDGRTGGWR
jgi:RNA polymerase sigma-B factor